MASFAGASNPFHWGTPLGGRAVIDIGAGAGIDSLIAARAVEPEGAVIGVDMTPAMLERARQAVRESALPNVEFREGLAEALPVPDGWADVVISNGVINLVPDKLGAYRDRAGASPWRPGQDSRHLRGATGPGVGHAGHRPVDRLNCGASAGRRVDDDHRGRGTG